MTAEEIKTIRDLQQRGLGYKKIATLTGVPVNSVKTYCRRHKVDAPPAEEPQAFCRGCGKPIQRIASVVSGADHVLTFRFRDGHTVKITWEKPSRAQSWTPEMRQAAAERTRQQRRKI